MTTKILITNDDGIDAPGIKHLWRALHEADIADLFIIAPPIQRSGAGLSITTDRPMLIEKVAWPDNTSAWTVDGTPADCIKMGVSIILNQKPDLIVSGINAGSNAGRNVLYSGTIGAVIEGIFRGIPGIAFSCEPFDTPNFELASRYVAAFVLYSLQHPLSAGYFLNVNFPPHRQEKVKGFRLTQQGKERWVEDPMLHTKTHHGPSYWLGNKREEYTEEKDSDVALLKQGYATAVPIDIQELTHKSTIHTTQHTFEKFFDRY